MDTVSFKIIRSRSIRNEWNYPSSDEGVARHLNKLFPINFTRGTHVFGHGVLTFRWECATPHTKSRNTRDTLVNTQDFISTDAYVTQFRSHPDGRNELPCFYRQQPSSVLHQRRERGEVGTRIEKFVNHFISTFHRDTTRYTIARSGISNGVKVSIEFHIDLLPHSPPPLPFLPSRAV